MKARPIGQIVAHSDNCDLRLLMDAMAPKDGSPTGLREDLNSLSDKQLTELKDMLQGDLDNTCKKLVHTVQEMLKAEEPDPDQTELDLDPPRDEVEVPAFLRRQT